MSLENNESTLVRLGGADRRWRNELKTPQRLQSVFCSYYLSFIIFISFFAGLLISNTWTLLDILIVRTGKTSKCSEFKIIEYNKKLKFMNQMLKI